MAATSSSATDLASSYSTIHGSLLPRPPPGDESVVVALRCVVCDVPDIGRSCTVGAVMTTDVDLIEVITTEVTTAYC